MDHLSTLLNNGTPVHVNLWGFVASGGEEARQTQYWGREEKNKKVPGVITKAYVPLDKPDLSEKDIKYLVSLCGGYRRRSLVLVHSAFFILMKQHLNAESVRIGAITVLPFERYSSAGLIF